MEAIKKYQIFANRYFGVDHQLELITDYPQQNNDYDCGVMMLFGMKDVSREYKMWSFSVQDCKYKRFQIAHEII